MERAICETCGREFEWEGQSLCDDCAEERSRKAEIACRNCGYGVATVEDAIDLIAREYQRDYVEQASIRLWHPDCALADGRIDSLDDLGKAPFYWELH